MTLKLCLLLATFLFSVGIYGLLSRKHAIAMFLSIEVMANAANLAFVAFAYHRGVPGQIAVLFGLAITVAEVAVGLALVLLMYRRHQNSEMDALTEARFVAPEATP